MILRQPRQFPVHPLPNRPHKLLQDMGKNTPVVPSPLIMASVLGVFPHADQPLQNGKLRWPANSVPNLIERFAADVSTIKQ